MGTVKFVADGNKTVSVEEMFRRQASLMSKEASLPFEEKIRILIQMQKRTADLRPDFNWPVWEISENVFAIAEGSDHTSSD